MATSLPDRTRRATLRRAAASPTETAGPARFTRRGDRVGEGV
ncbi:MULTISPECIES: DUF6380 family protein [Streptomyces]|jgi:hypothetical protein|uniref:Uncharacterized protein n=1 Tax=Streptomyces calvus TaxID=67282 RepID=A0AA40S8S6_9ACTN|nr:hypothetical protein [Streptomyces calvus]MBA8976188.1 hypothetical protein [Streptomyces calvus]